MSRPRTKHMWEHEVAIGNMHPGVEPVYCRIPFNQRHPNLSDVLAARAPGRPWLLALWEPLLTHAPSPSRAQPYCCYLRTVIFYHRPYIARGRHPWRCNGRWEWEPDPRSFAQFDQIETRLGWNDIVRFDGDEFEVACGMVVWHRKRWWMRRSARRRPPQAQRAA